MLIFLRKTIFFSCKQLLTTYHRLPFKNGKLVITPEEPPLPEAQERVKRKENICIQRTVL
jgi:hypothetical protein